MISSCRSENNSPALPPKPKPRKYRSKPGHLSGLFAEPLLRRILKSRLFGPDEDALHKVLVAFITASDSWAWRKRSEAAASLGARLDQVTSRWRRGRASAAETVGALLDRLPAEPRAALWDAVCEEGGVHLAQLSVLRSMKDISPKPSVAAYTCASCLAAEFGGAWSATSTTPGEVSMHAGGVRWDFREDGDRVWVDGTADVPCQLTGLVKMGQVVFSKVGLELCKAFAEKHKHVRRTRKSPHTAGHY